MRLLALYWPFDSKTSLSTLFFVKSPALQIKSHDNDFQCHCHVNHIDFLDTTSESLEKELDTVKQSLENLDLFHSTEVLWKYSEEKGFKIQFPYFCPIP